MNSLLDDCPIASTTLLELKRKALRRKTLRNPLRRHPARSYFDLPLNADRLLVQHACFHFKEHDGHPPIHPQGLRFLLLRWSLVLYAVRCQPSFLSLASLDADVRS
jgi:hypothetical protein